MMNQAQVELEIVHDRRPGATQIRLVPGIYILGSDHNRIKDEDYILLDEPELNAAHVQIRYSALGWMARALTRTAHTTSEGALEAGEDRQLTPNTVIPIGRFHRLRIKEVYALPQGTPSVKGSIGIELMALEGRVTEALIEYEERARSHSHGVDGDHRVAALSKELDIILSNEIVGLPRSELMQLVNDCLLRTLVYRCVEAGSETLRKEKYAHLHNADREQLNRLIEDVLRTLDVRLTADSATETIGKIHDTPPHVMADLDLGIDDNFAMALIGYVVREEVLSLFFGLGPLQFLLESEIVSEIMVTRFDQVFVEKGSEIFNTSLDLVNEKQLRTIVGKLLGRANRTINEGVPYQDARLPDGSRVNAVIPPIALKGSSITIRKFANRRFTLQDLADRSSMSQAMMRLLVACVKSRKNMVVSGGTGSGKTTLLNSLAAEIPMDERLVTIEDTAELVMQQPNTVSLQSRPASPDGRGQVTIQQLVVNALRMRPDRLLVGECRGGETFDMLQAMNTGHNGSLTTAHANNPQELMLRLESMVLMGGMDMPVSAIRQQIAAAVDVVVQAQRVDGARRIVEIAEVVDLDLDTGQLIVEPIFRYQGGKDGRYAFTGVLPTFFDDLVAAGQIDIERFLGVDTETPSPA